MPRVNRAGVALAFSLVVATARPASAQERELRYDPIVDGAVTIAGATVWGISELFKSSLVGTTCGLCERDAAGNDTLNGFDKGVRSALVWSNTGAADAASNVLAFAVLPLGGLGFDAIAASHDGRLAAWPVDALVIAEAAILAGNANQITKFLVRRERPFVHVLPPDEKALTSQPSDNNLSFFSGHTTLTFALASAVGTVATMRGYKLAPYTWVTLMPIAALTGYLRIAADKHYATDVITGAVVGSAMGFAVPFLFHRPLPSASAADSQSPAIAIAPAPRGAAITASFVW
jgi:membrane-associated phospholipid phosphatase